MNHLPPLISDLALILLVAGSGHRHSAQIEATPCARLHRSWFFGESTYALYAFGARPQQH